MILELEVRHFALLHDVKVEFGKGLNVFTGETGAGKSLLVDALEFLLGHASVSDGSVQGIFRPSKEAAQFLSQEGFEALEELYLSRESKPGGKTVSRLNGTLVPVGKIKALSPFLVEVHSQHSHHTLFDPKTHLLLLDAFCGIDSPCGDVPFGDLPPLLHSAFLEQFKLWRDLEKRCRELGDMESRREREMDLCQYELAEIEKAKLFDGEEELLREEKEKLAQIVRLQQIFSELLDLADRVHFPKMISHLEKLASFEKKLTPWVPKFQEWDYEWVELKDALASCRESFLPDPLRIESIIERLDLIQRLKKKYGGSVPEILSYAKSRREQLESLESVTENLRKLEKELKIAGAILEELSLKLSEKRKESARRLKNEIEKEFKMLAIPHGRFQVMFDPLESWTSSGKDRVEFQVSLNPGEPLMPLEKTASGGELSRIMLALRTILASAPVPTLVFDEIDAGLGGEAAFHVAERLQLLSGTKQVLCVTHLHQVASAADHHFSVEKRSDNGKTFATVKPLSKEEKIYELARMMGGTRTTDALLVHARQLFSTSQAKKGRKKLLERTGDL